MRVLALQPFFGRKVILSFNLTEPVRPSFLAALPLAFTLSATVPFRLRFLTDLRTDFEPFRVTVPAVPILAFRVPVPFLRFTLNRPVFRVAPVQTRANRAFTDSASSIVTSQVGVDPEQPPSHPAKLLPESGVADRVTLV